MHKLEDENNSLSIKLGRSYEQLGKALDRLDREMEKIEGYLRTCQMLKTEIGLSEDRMELAKR